MKRQVILLCALAIGRGAISTNSLFANPAGAENQIRQLEDKMNAAYATNDLAAYFAYYADDFVQWLPEGRTDLEKYKKDWTAYVGAGNKVEGVEIRELMVRVDAAEDSAVASYTLYVKTKLADGKVTEEANQETDVWFKRNGTWKVVALHYSPAAKK